jgi:hypothetical protein
VQSRRPFKVLAAALALTALTACSADDSGDSSALQSDSADYNIGSNLSCSWVEQESSPPFIRGACNIMKVNFNAFKIPLNETPPRDGKVWVNILNGESNMAATYDAGTNAITVDLTNYRDESIVLDISYTGAEAETAGTTP